MRRISVDIYEASLTLCIMMTEHITETHVRQGRAASRVVRSSSGMVDKLTTGQQWDEME